MSEEILNNTEAVKNAEENLAQETEEYVTFTVLSKDNTEVEMAVVDEFEFEKKNYIVAAKVIGDSIDTEGQYIYRCRLEADGSFKAEKITNALDYEKVVNAYMEMEE